MKNFIIFTFLGYALNVVAQTSPLAYFHKQSMPDWRKDIAVTTGSPHLEGTSETWLNLVEEMLQLQSRFDFIQLQDSVITWSWDYDSQSWIFETKTTDIIYDTHQQLASFTEQEWSETQWINADQYFYTRDDQGRLTEYVRKVWDGFAWQNNTRFEYTYDENGNSQTGILSNWDGAAWEYYIRSESVFDQNNNRTSSIVQLWDNNAWVNLNQTLYTFDANNNLLDQLDQNWTGTAWLDVYKLIYTYDMDNYLKTGISQNWNGVSLENAGRYEYFYDNDHNRIQAHYESWLGISWQNVRLESSTFDEQNNLTAETVQIWNGAVWENYKYYTYNYDQENNLAYSLEQEWNGLNWENVFQSTYAYDDQSNLTQYLIKAWNGQWIDYDLTAYTYDENNFELSYVYKGFDDFGEFIYGDSTYYYFHTLSGVEDKTLSGDLIRIYPNPGDGRFSFSGEADIQAVSVYNTLGELIYAIPEDSGNHLQSIDLSGHGAGIYFVHIKTSRGSTTRKLLIQ